MNVVILDGDITVIRNICNGASRERYLYTSTNSEIQFHVQLESGEFDSEEMGFFLLQYQGEYQPHLADHGSALITTTALVFRYFRLQM